MKFGVFLRRDGEDGVACYCRVEEVVGVGGMENTGNRLAASSLVTKIHAGAKPPPPTWRKAATRRPAAAKSRRYFCLDGLYSTSSARANAPPQLTGDCGGWGGDPWGGPPKDANSQSHMKTS